MQLRGDEARQRPEGAFLVALDKPRPSAIAEPFIDCEVAYFPPEVEAARDWLLWPEGAADII